MFCRKLLKTFDLMKDFWKSLFKLNKRPVVNILIRTSNRPNYFKTCIESVYQQSYKHKKIFVSYDDQQTYEYLKLYKGIKPVSVISINQNNPELEIPYEKQRTKFPANLYVNELMKKVKSGYVLCLDDDDCFMDTNSLQTIVNNISGKDDLLFWRVQFPEGKLIPEDEYFGKPPEFCHISGIGFTFNHKYIKDAQWDSLKGSDFVVANNLFKTIPNKIYINEVLTGLQRQVNWGGFGSRDDKNE